MLLGKKGMMRLHEYTVWEDEDIGGSICPIATAEEKGTGGKACRERAVKVPGSQHKEMVMNSQKILTLKVPKFAGFSICSVPSALSILPTCQGKRFRSSQGRSERI